MHLSPKEPEPLLDPKSKFLLRQFAHFKNMLQARLAYEEKFGETPTDFALHRANLGAFMREAKHKAVQRSKRGQYFRDSRRKYLESLKANTPLAIREVRLERLGELFEIELVRARKTGNTGKAVSILEAAARESVDYYAKGNTTTVNIDARSIGNMPSEELDKRINALISSFGAHLTANAIAQTQSIEDHSGPMIEHEGETESETEGEFVLDEAEE